MNSKQPVIREIGTSQGIIIPKSALGVMDGKVGSPIGYKVDSGKMEIWLLVNENERGLETICEK